MKVGMIGTGAVAQRHLQALRSLDIAIAAHLGTTAEKASTAALTWGGQGYGDLDAFVRSGRPDCVFITVPPDAHGAIERRLIADGIPFLVEKPLSADRGCAEDIADLVAKHGVTAAAGYQWRALDVLPDVRTYLATRPPRMLIGEFLVGTPASPWWIRKSRSGGQFIEQTCHLLDLARSLAGEAQVEAALEHGFPRPAYPDADIAGATAAMLRHAGGAITILSAACTLPGGETYAVNLRVICDGALITLSLSGAAIEDADGRRDIPVRENPYAVQARAFLAAVAAPNSARALCSYADALITHRLCHDVVEAAETRAR